MRVRRVITIGASAIAACALSAAVASAAVAADANLYISKVEQTNETHHAIETHIKSTTFTLESKVGETPFTLSSTGVTSSGAYIYGTTAGAKDAAESIEFTGTTVTSPSTCTKDVVTSRKSSTGTKTATGVVATKPVTTVFNSFDTSKVEDLFSPAEGEIFVEIELKKEGTCPIPTSYYEVTGKEAGEELAPTTESVSKTLDFPKPSLATSTLKFAGEPAELYGEAELKLTGGEDYTVSQTTP